VNYSTSRLPNARPPLPAAVGHLRKLPGSRAGPALNNWERIESLISCGAARTRLGYDKPFQEGACLLNCAFFGCRALASLAQRVRSRVFSFCVYSVGTHIGSCVRHTRIRGVHSRPLEKRNALTMRQLKFIGGIGFTLVIVAGVGAAYLYSGAFNVAASAPHTAFEQSLFRTAMRRSVVVMSRSISQPPRFHR